jgi:glycosyltransferase involved in cell wall biosynthesis
VSIRGSSSKPRVVIAGQLPPPQGGQNIMIARLLSELHAHPEIQTEHLAFQFTSDFKTARKGGLSKLIELIKVIRRLLQIRSQGPIDLLIYPPGGPQNIPLIRDILLLPWILLFSRQVVLHFHAGGIADRLQTGGMIPSLAARLYRLCPSAIVMTDFNRRDPQACGIHHIQVIPHRLDDSYNPDLKIRNQKIKNKKQINLLYVGHLCPDKGTDQLLEAFATLNKDYPEIRLELVGECLPPWNQNQLSHLLQRLAITDKVVLSGVLTGEEKWQAYARADLFIFSSIAPYESFGLVLVEAMMWSLPIVATDWRGNRDVSVGSEAFFWAWVSSNQKTALLPALKQAINSANLNILGKINRQSYLNHYLNLRYKQSEIVRIIQSLSLF